MIGLKIELKIKLLNSIYYKKIINKYKSKI